MSNFSLSIFYTYLTFFFGFLLCVCRTSFQALDTLAPFFGALKNHSLKNNDKNTFNVEPKKRQIKHKWARSRNRKGLWKTRAHKIGASSPSSCHHHQHRLLLEMEVAVQLALFVYSTFLCSESPFYSTTFYYVFQIDSQRTIHNSIVSLHSSRHEIDHFIYMTESSGPIVWCFNNRSFRFILSFQCIYLLLCCCYFFSFSHTLLICVLLGNCSSLF